MSITGDALYLYSQPEQIGQIFSQFLEPFPIGKAIKLGKFDGAVPVNNQTKVLAEIGAINKKVDPFRGKYTENGKLIQVLIKKTCQGPYRVAAFT